MIAKRYWFLLFLLTFLLFRGLIFRACIRYECMKEVSIPSIQSVRLKEHIKEGAKDFTSGNWAMFAQAYAADHLRFTHQVSTSTPDAAWESGRAHCVGYAALMGAILKEVVDLKQETLLECRPEIRQCRGDIYLFGFRLTGSDRPVFFRDHDYIEVYYPCQERLLSYDPSVYDYLRVAWVGRK